MNQKERTCCLPALYFKCVVEVSLGFFLGGVFFLTTLQEVSATVHILLEPVSNLTFHNRTREERLPLSIKVQKSIRIQEYKCRSTNNIRKSVVDQYGQYPVM